MFPWALYLFGAMNHRANVVYLSPVIRSTCSEPPPYLTHTQGQVPNKWDSPHVPGVLKPSKPVYSNVLTCSAGPSPQTSNEGSGLGFPLTLSAS